MRRALAEEQNPSRIMGGFGFSRLNHPRRSVAIVIFFELFVVLTVGLGLLWLLRR